MIYKYNLWPKSINNFYSLSSEMKSYYPYHGTKIYGTDKCPDGYALDLNNNICLSTDILPHGTFFKYKDRIIKHSLPIIVSVINSYGELEWKLDVGVAEHLKYLRN